MALSLLRLQLPSSLSSTDAPGFCISYSLTAVSKVQLELALQIAVCIAMAALYGAVTVARRLLASAQCRGRCCLRSRTDGADGIGLRTVLNGNCEPLLQPERCDGHGDGRNSISCPDGDFAGVRHASALGHPTSPCNSPDDIAVAVTAPASAATIGVTAAGSGALDARDTNDAGTGLGAVSAGVTGDDATTLSLRARGVAATVNFLLSVYANVTIAVVKLLHCVHVPGTPPTARHLFIDGTVECDDRRQLPLVRVVVVLVTALVAVPLLHRWSAGVPRGAGPAPVSLQSWKSDAQRGVRRALFAAYTCTVPGWEAVLMAHRLVLALLLGFGSAEPGLQSLCAVAVCVVALVAHLLVQPLRSMVSQRCQSVLLVCLVGVTLCATVNGVAEEKAVSGYATASDVFASVGTLIAGTIIPCCALAWAYVGEAVASRLSRLAVCRLRTAKLRVT